MKNVDKNFFLTNISYLSFQHQNSFVSKLVSQSILGFPLFIDPLDFCKNFATYPQVEEDEHRWSHIHYCTTHCWCQTEIHKQVRATSALWRWKSLILPFPKHPAFSQPRLLEFYPPLVVSWCGHCDLGDIRLPLPPHWSCRWHHLHQRMTRSDLDGGCWSLGRSPWSCSWARCSEVQRMRDNFLSGVDKVCTSLQSVEEGRVESWWTSCLRSRSRRQVQEPAMGFMIICTNGVVGD